MQTLFVAALFLAVNCAVCTRTLSSSNPSDTQSTAKLQQLCNGDGASVSISSVTNSTDDVAASRFPWAEPLPTSDLGSYCKTLESFNNEKDQYIKTGKALPLLFYGDEVLQCYQYEAEQCKGATSVFQQYFKQYAPEIWAIGSDTISSLMWRIENAGNSPSGLHNNVIVVYIGIQDLLQAPQNPDSWKNEMADIADRMDALVSYLLDESEAQLLLMGWLPLTGFDSKGKPTLVVPDLYKEAITFMNDNLQSLSTDQFRVTYVDCGSAFYVKGSSTKINRNYMIGTLPTGKGFQKIAECLQPHIAKYI